MTHARLFHRVRGGIILDKAIRRWLLRTYVSQSKVKNMASEKIKSEKLETAGEIVTW